MNKTPVLLIALILMLSGCDSDPATESPGSVLPGDIFGKLNLIDTTGNSIADKSGVVVSIERTPYSATSDSNGIFKLHSIPAGTYTFRFEKENFGTTKNFSIQHTGNGTLYLEGYAFNSYDATLHQVPKRKIELTLSPFVPQLTYRDTSWVDSLGKVVHSYVYDSVLTGQFFVPFGGSTTSSYPLLYFAKDADINPKDINSFSYITYLRTGSGSFTAAVTIDSLWKYGFTSGTKVFVQTARIVSGYYDVETRTIVNTYGYFSDVRSFILP